MDNGLSVYACIVMDKNNSHHNNSPELKTMKKKVSVKERERGSEKSTQSKRDQLLNFSSTVCIIHSRIG